MCSMVGIDGDRGALGGALGGADVGHLLLAFGEMCMRRLVWVVVITAALMGATAVHAVMCQTSCYWVGNQQYCTTYCY